MFASGILDSAAKGREGAEGCRKEKKNVTRRTFILPVPVSARFLESLTPLSETASSPSSRISEKDRRSDG